MEKKVFLNFAALWIRAFGFKIFIKVMNLMWHTLLYMWTLQIWISVHWMTHKLALYLETQKVLHSLWWNLWCIGDLYLNVVRGGGHDDKFTWKMKLSATRWTPKIFP